jgi:hypothetical protein
MIHDSDIYESAKNGILFSISEHWYGKGGEYYILVNEDDDKEIKIKRKELELMVEEKRLIKK